MKWPALLIGIFWVTSLFPQSGPREDFLLPFNFQVDSVSLLATWQPPKIILLNEDFEGDIFPPYGWSDSTLGVGWQGVSSPSYQAWEVPDHPGKFALANDDAAGYSNNGSLDQLFTPMLDLTVADGFMLTFDSYFDAGWGQEAYVKYSIDNGTTWQLLLDVPAKLGWQKIMVDLSEFSGEDGESNIQLQFHTDDLGYFASGWALDNVLVTSDEIGEHPEYYKIFFENRQIAQVSDTFYQYYIEYNTTRKCCIVAKYNDGVSDTVSQMTHSSYLAAPRSLVGNAPDDIAILYWSSPVIPLYHYNRMYLDSLYCFQSAAASIEGGCCADGEYIYSVFEGNDSVYKYDFFGNIIEKFTIPGIPGLFDLTYNSSDQHYYGGNGSNVLYKMNFQDHTLVDTYAAPVVIRGLAYDQQYDGFWANDWSTMLVLFDLEGNQLNSFWLQNYGNIYGLECDYMSDGGPYLWAFSRDGTGNVLVQVDLLTGLETGYTKDLSYLSMNNGLAGGLYFDLNPYLGAYVLGGNIQNDVFFGLKLPVAGLITSKIPDNLLGFNIYKDDEFLAYSPGYEPLYYVNSYLDTLNEPQGAIQYEVSAVYDMTEYGFPGDTAESEREGPALVISPLPLLELDYFEDWEYFSYDWILPDGEWQISQDIGHDAPAAVFMPDSILTGYGSSLKSFLFLAYESQRIYLSYDISLVSNQPSGNEILEVQVLDYTSESWHTVMTYSNSDGSFDWRRDTFEITNYFNGNGFRIRFMALGDNSADIEYWVIDNIAVFHSCEPPANVETNLGPMPEDSIRITWQEPWPTLAEWRQWDDGVHFSSVGYGTGKTSWSSIAQRWTPEQLAGLKDASLTAIGFIPCEGSSFYVPTIWRGQNREIVYSQASGNVVLNEWNVIQLDEPVPVDIAQELLVGYQLSEYTGYPISVDNGPAIDSFGNLMQLGLQWYTMLEINPDLDYNFNIKAYFERDSIPVEKYELYRSIDGSDYEMIAEPEVEEYLDPVFNWNAEYCYALKAVYPYEVCVSGYSEESCIVVVSSDPVEISDNSFIHIYPNPSSGNIFIESSEEMKSISVYNVSGMMIYEEEVNDFSKEIQLEEGPGIYVIRVQTIGNICFRKVVSF